jgi:hypothetical protein
MLKVIFLLQLSGASMNKNTLFIILLCYGSFSSAMDTEKAKELQPSSSQSDYHPSLSTPEKDLRTLSNSSSTPRSMTDFDSNVYNSNNYYAGLSQFNNITPAQLHSPEFKAQRETILKHSSTGADPEAQRTEELRKIRAGEMEPNRGLVDTLWRENNELHARKDELERELEETKRQLLQFKKRRICACLRSNE